MLLPQIGMPGTWEWVIILAIVILIFGAAKLPDLARATGQSLRIFKAETKGLNDDLSDKSDDEAAGELPAAEQPVEGEIVEPRRDTSTS